MVVPHFRTIVFRPFLRYEQTQICFSLGATAAALTVTQFRLKKAWLRDAWMDGTQARYAVFFARQVNHI